MEWDDLTVEIDYYGALIIKASSSISACHIPEPQLGTCGLLIFQYNSDSRIAVSVKDAIAAI